MTAMVKSLLADGVKKMVKDFENKFVIAHVFVHKLYKDDKNLTFDTKDEAKAYLKKHVYSYFQSCWHVCSIKEYNEFCRKHGLNFLRLEND